MVKFTTSAIATMALLAASSEAFTSPSFVAPRHALPAAYNPNAKLMQSTYSTARPTSALQMNLFDRFVRVAKSNVDAVLKSVEDPEKIMSQALEDMQVCIFDFWADAASIPCYSIGFLTNEFRPSFL